MAAKDPPAPGAVCRRPVFWRLPVCPDSDPSFRARRSGGRRKVSFPRRCPSFFRNRLFRCQHCEQCPAHPAQLHCGVESFCPATNQAYRRHPSASQCSSSQQECPALNLIPTGHSEYRVRAATQGGPTAHLPATESSRRGSRDRQSGPVPMLRHSALVPACRWVYCLSSCPRRVRA